MMVESILALGFRIFVALILYILFNLIYEVKGHLLVRIIFLAGFAFILFYAIFIVYFSGIWQILIDGTILIVLFIFMKKFTAKPIDG